MQEFDTNNQTVLVSGKFREFINNSQWNNLDKLKQFDVYEINSKFAENSDFSVNKHYIYNLKSLKQPFIKGTMK